MTEEKTAAIIFLASVVSMLTHWIAWIAGDERENSPGSATIIFIVLLIVLASTILLSLVFLLLSAFN